VLEPWTEERAQAWWDEHLPIGADLRPPTRSDVHVDFPAPPVT